MINYPLRFCLASIVPIGLYTLGYWSNFLLTSQRPGYFRKEPWFIIFGLAALFPLNKPLLWMLFRPIEKKVTKDIRRLVPPAHRNPFLKRNFAPVHKEVSYEVSDIIKGKIPRDIEGVFMKTGPNPIAFHESGAYHWFDGDCMFHAFRLRDGRLHYCNKQIMTPGVQQNVKDGHKALQLGAMIGTGVLGGPLWTLENAVGYRQDPPLEMSSSPNTAITYFQKQIYGLIEVNYPFKVDLVQNRDGTIGLKEAGHVTYDNQLTHPMSAHPKVDRQTNELFAFSYDFEKPKVYLSVFNKELQLINKLSWSLLNVRMLHDYSITKSFAIIPDVPLEMNPKRALLQQDYIFHNNLEGASRFGFHPRKSSNPADIVWIDTPGFPFFFHQANAWEEVNEDGDLMVYICAVPFSKFEPGFPGSEPLMQNRSRFEKLTFNLSKRTYEGRQLLVPDCVMEFPVIEQSLVGYKNRYSYVSFSDGVVEQDVEARENANFKGFFKYDHFEEKVVAKVSFGVTHFGGEVFFQRKTSAPEEITPENEDEGYLMTAVHNWKTDTSEFVMWDAATLGEGRDEPILRAGLKQRVPYGFHTMFVPSNELN